MNVLLVFVGGGVGSLIRYAVALAMKGCGCPWATFAVNILGCFVIGFVSALFARTGWNGSFRLMLTVGFCGGFTTFSTFSNETYQMLVNSQWLPLVAYLASSIVLGLGAVALGYRLGM